MDSNSIERHFKIGDGHQSIDNLSETLHSLEAEYNNTGKPAVHLAHKYIRTHIDDVTIALKDFTTYIESVTSSRASISLSTSALMTQVFINYHGEQSDE